MAMNLFKRRKKRTVYLCPKGYTKNPLESYPRNELCPCGSEKKFKKCCIDLVKSQWIPIKKAKKYADFIARFKERKLEK